MPESAKKKDVVIRYFLVYMINNTLEGINKQTNKLTSGEAWDVLAATPILLTEDVAVAGL